MHYGESAKHQRKCKLMEAFMFCIGRTRACICMDPEQQQCMVCHVMFCRPHGHVQLQMHTHDQKSFPTCFAGTRVCARHCGSCCGHSATHSGRPRDGCNAQVRYLYDTVFCVIQKGVLMLDWLNIQRTFKLSLYDCTSHCGPTR